VSGTTTLNVTLSPALQTELANKSGVYAYSVWYDNTNTIGTWNTLVFDGTIENSGTTAISLPNTVNANDQTNGGKVYFIIQSADTAQAYVPITQAITSQSDINWNNAGTYDFGYDSFEVSLEGASGDAGNLSSVNAFGLPMEVSVPSNNASVGYAVSGSSIASDIANINPSATAIYNYTTGALQGDFRLAPSPVTALSNSPTLTNPAFSTSDWTGYVSNIQTAVMNGTLLNPIVLSGEFDGAPSVLINNGTTATVWHNGGYFAYQLKWDSGHSAFELDPLPQSQIKGTIEITPAALAANIYQPGLATPGDGATIYSNGTVYSDRGLTEPMNTGANNQWGKVLADLFTGFTGGFYLENGKPLNPQATGSIDLNQNMNWDPGYAFGNDVIKQSATYTTFSDPYSQIFYQHSNSYGSAYSDNLMSQYTAGGPLISVFDSTAGTDVGTIDLTIFANSETPSPVTSQGYTPPQIYNYISATSTSGYDIPTNFTSGDNITLVFAASVAHNAGIVLNGTETITLAYLTSDTGGIPSWATIAFDGATAGTLGLWQDWTVVQQGTTYTAQPAPNTGQTPGSMVITNLPVVDSGVSWYQIGVGTGASAKSFNLYTTMLNGQFENTNHAGQQGALAVDGLAKIVPGSGTQQTTVTFSIDFAPSSAITVDPSLFVPNTGTAAVNGLSSPYAPVAGTLSGGTFNALPGQIVQTTTINKQIVQSVETISIATLNPHVAFGWTGDNNDPSATSAIAGYTNKINAGDVARVTIQSSGGTIVATGTADIDGMWNTGAVVLNGTIPALYTATVQEFLPTDSLFATPLTPMSTALVLNVTCFAAGTRIATERGEIAVEALRAGERVQLVVGSAREVVWIGQRIVDCSRHPRPEQVWPVRIAAGAFGTGLPHRDLLLSPDHAVYVGDVLIPVKYLINGSSIAQVPVDAVTYYHVELPQHGVLLAEGLPVESYLDTGDRGNFANGDGPVALHPDFASRAWEASGCAPLMVTGPEVDAARYLVAASTTTHARTVPQAAA
jgi:hypothetical protein